eukprot:tig00001127_g7146.t1
MGGSDKIERARIESSELECALCRIGIAREFIASGRSRVILGEVRGENGSVRTVGEIELGDFRVRIDEDTRIAKVGPTRYLIQNDSHDFFEVAFSSDSSGDALEGAEDMFQRAAGAFAPEGSPCAMQIMQDARMVPTGDTTAADRVITMLARGTTTVAESVGSAEDAINNYIRSASEFAKHAAGGPESPAQGEPGFIVSSLDFGARGARSMTSTLAGAANVVVNAAAGGVARVADGTISVTSRLLGTFQPLVADSTERLARAGIYSAGEVYGTAAEAMHRVLANAADAGTDIVRHRLGEPASRVARSTGGIVKDLSGINMSAGRIFRRAAARLASQRAFASGAARPASPRVAAAS